MWWPLFTAGIGLGFVSSFHCVGMCGPIALALPVHHFSGAQRLLAILLYNLGRTTTYALLGLLFGIAGRQLYIGGLQQWFSIVAGIAMLLFLVAALLQKRVPHLSFGSKWQIQVQRVMSRYLQHPKLYGTFIIGLANGLLPCGMVYFAVAGALATGSVQGGIWFMAGFGAGTIPLIMLFSYFGMMMSLAARNAMRKAVPYAIGLMGVLLVLRGMNLGIPYVSPHMNAPTQTISCH
jgi:uncharacterized protein